MEVCNYCYDKPARHVDNSFNYIIGAVPAASVTRHPLDISLKLTIIWDDRIMDVPDVDDADNFSDSDAFEIDDNLLNEDQKHYKNIIQEVLKWQYFKDRAEKEAMFAAAKEAYEKLKADRKIDVAASNSGNEQAAKEAAAAAAKEAYKDLNVAQEIDVATSNSGKERQQKRAAEAGYPASDESASETTLRMLAKKVASENTKRRESESHSDNENKGRESQDTFEIGELELEGYFGNGGSVRRRGIWKPNGLQKCNRKLSS
ncbi:hypothetical protein Q3G72_008060 [Acer saccharum]|nr:hypothetical protein Q3G72_008060 [Acer saccharum]